MLCISAVFDIESHLSVRLSVRPSQSGIVSKRLNLSSEFFHYKSCAHRSTPGSDGHSAQTGLSRHL